VKTKQRGECLKPKPPGHNFELCLLCLPQKVAFFRQENKREEVAKEHSTFPQSRQLVYG